GPDRIIQEYAMHGFPHGVISPEGERHIANTPADTGKWHSLLYHLDRFDEVDRIVIVFLDAGGYRKNIRVENNVLGIIAYLFGEYLISPLADAHLFFQGI